MKKNFLWPHGDFEVEEPLSQGELLKFNGVGDRDVYNITAPFMIAGCSYIAGRVEERAHWANSETVIFKKNKFDIWDSVLAAPMFKLEDPFVTTIGGELILGGVEVYLDPTAEDSIGFITVFYRGETIEGLKRFSVGPKQMKDIRLVELADGKIGVFSRPQGKIGGRGKIGFTIVNDIEAVTAENIKQAPLIKGLIPDDDGWMGTNQALLLENGTIGVLGHIAYEDARGQLHYCAIAFRFNPKTLEHTPPKIIARRENFPPGPAKNSKLRNVVFPGGIRYKSDGSCDFYLGLSDVQARRVPIRNPFIN